MLSLPWIITIALLVIALPFIVIVVSELAFGYTIKFKNEWLNIGLNILGKIALFSLGCLTLWCGFMFKDIMIILIGLIWIVSAVYHFKKAGPLAWSWWRR